MVLENFLADADILWDRAGKKLFEKPEARTGRKMRVRVTNKGLVEDLTGYTLNLGWKSTIDETKFGLDAFTAVDITKGIFEIAYTSGMLSNLGCLTGALQLVPTVGEPIESNNFFITVVKSAVDTEAIQSETSFTALALALVNVNAWNATISGKVIDWEADMAATKQLYIDNMEEVDATYPIELNSVKQQLADTTMMATNKLTNGDFSNGLTGWNNSGATVTLDNTYLTTKVKIVNAVTYKGINQSKSFVDNNLIYASFIGCGNVAAQITTSDSEFAVFTMTATPNRYSKVTKWLSNWVDALGLYNVGVGTNYYGYFISIDLTATFGVGNEPTAEQMDRLLVKFPNSWFEGTENLFLAKWALNELRRLDSEKANKVQEAWITPTLVNSWVAFDTRTAKYKKADYGRIYLKGVVKSGTIGATIFTLPTGYRPDEALIFGVITVNVNGTVVCTSGVNTSVSLSSVNFFV